MKWTGMYFFGFFIFIGGVLAALWKLGVLDRIGTTWTVIGVVIALGNWYYGLGLKQWHQRKYRNQPEVKNVSVGATVRVACRPGLSNRCSCRLLWRRQIS